MNEEFSFTCTPQHKQVQEIISIESFLSSFPITSSQLIAFQSSIMVNLASLIRLIAVISGVISPIIGQNAAFAAATQWPLHDDGLNKVVQWDHYSYMINGERLFLFGGEVLLSIPWRYPANQSSFITGAILLQNSGKTFFKKSKPVVSIHSPSMHTGVITILIRPLSILRMVRITSRPFSPWRKSLGCM